MAGTFILHAVSLRLGLKFVKGIFSLYWLWSVPDKFSAPAADNACPAREMGARLFDPLPSAWLQVAGVGADRGWLICGETFANGGGCQWWGCGCWCELIEDHLGIIHGFRLLSLLSLFLAGKGGMGGKGFHIPPRTREEKI